MGKQRFMLGISAGFIKSEAQARECLNSTADLITLGSYTWDSRDENPTPNYIDTDRGSLNSLGLPNQGVRSLKDWIVSFLTEARKRGKHVRISIAAFSPEDYARCVEYLIKIIPRKFWETCCSVELNLGCPNVWGKAGQKPIASLNPHVMRDVVQAVRQTLDYHCAELAAKVSPFVDPTMFEPAWHVCMHALVTRIVTMNTFPNGCGFSGEGRPLISGTGLAGVAGKAVKLIALGQVKQWTQQRTLYGDRGPFKYVGGSSGNAHARLDTYIDGVGGVENAADVIDMKLAGASNVLIGTAFGEKGHDLFETIGEALPESILVDAA